MTTAYPPTMSTHRPARSLEQYRDELATRLRNMPMTHYSALGELAVRLHQVEEEIREQRKCTL